MKIVTKDAALRHIHSSSQNLERLYSVVFRKIVNLFRTLKGFCGYFLICTVIFVSVVSIIYCVGRLR